MENVTDLEEFMFLILYRLRKNDQLALTRQCIKLKYFRCSGAYQFAIPTL